MFCGFEEIVVFEKIEVKMGKREVDRFNIIV